MELLVESDESAAWETMGVMPINAAVRTAAKFDIVLVDFIASPLDDDNFFSSKYFRLLEFPLLLYLAYSPLN